MDPDTSSGVPHAYLTPPELKGESSHYPVIICGGGPVGLTAAACLARFGIGSVVLEKNLGAAAGSRAICLSRRSLEILDWAGAAGPFVAKGLGWTQGRAFYRDRLIHELRMPHSEAEKFPPMTNLQQFYMEEFLARHCEQRTIVDVRWGNVLVDLARQPDSLALTVATPEGEYRLSCSWLIAADGARSPIRRLLRLSLAGSSFGGRYLIADIRLRSAYPTERRAWFDPPSNRGLTVLMHRQPEDVWRIDYQLGEHDDAEDEVRPERVRERVQRHLDFIGERGEWELLWTSIYSAHSLALESYVHGRVIFAGDAAHLVPIFGVRGLNSGLADAHNLAWKLAWILGGDADERLLETYASERRNATLDIHRQADKSTRFMTPTSRGDTLMREAVLSLAVEHEFVRPLVDPRQSVPYTYRDSPLNTVAEPPGSFHHGPAPGAPLRNLQVRCGQRAGYLLDWLGVGFTALLFLSDDSIAEHEVAVNELLDLTGQHSGAAVRLLIVSRTHVGTLASPGDRATLLEDVTAAAPELYDIRPGTVYLARPDGHVCARWRRVTGGSVGAALRRACART